MNIYLFTFFFIHDDFEKVFVVYEERWKCDKTIGGMMNLKYNYYFYDWQLTTFKRYATHASLT
jgi:hypothetical protein